MNNRRAFGQNVFRYNFWFVPAVMTIGLAALAFGLLRVEASVAGTLADRVIPLEAAGVRRLLSMLGATMMTVATTAFSIVIVALQLASGQLGPRLLRNFIGDRGNQIAFGIFVGTFVYCLVVLRVLASDIPRQDLPHTAILGAIVLAGAAVGVLIFFIHHAASSIQKDRVIAQLSGEISRSVTRLYPKTIGHEPRVTTDERGATFQQLDPDRISSDWPDATDIRLDGGGYVQAIDEQRLMKLTVSRDLCVHIRRRPGDYVPYGSVVARVRPAERLGPSERRQLSRVFVLGAERTIEQDVAFVFDQLVEIALRALSSSANDSFTAIRCIDRLGDGLARVARTTVPSPYRVDAQGTLRVITSPINFDVMLTQVFYPVAAMASDNTIVMRRLFGAAEMIAHACEHTSTRQSVHAFVDYMTQTLETVPLPRSVREEFAGQAQRIQRIEPG